jgi:hypothetical protein
MVRANPDNRLVKPLTELLLLSWGPLQVVAEEFAGLRGAGHVLIFGSWAALPGLSRDLHPDAQRPAALVQVRQRHPAGHAA